MAENGSRRDQNTALGVERYYPHRWTCLICDRSPILAADFESASKSVVRKRATVALLAHVRASSDATHGPTDEYPADFDPYSIEGYVVPLGDRSNE